MRELYKRYESGASLRNLQDWLEENQIKTVLGESKWTTTSIKSILTNEKYCGDVLLQKTFRTDVISRKVIKNVGQMAQYYMPDHHEAIVSREQYNAVKAEMARRSALRSPSKTAVTGRSCYTSKYALSDRLVCGECGTLYRRCTWTSLGRKYPVWRCTSRLNYGTKYCRDSPTIKEEPLQAAILEAINAATVSYTHLSVSYGARTAGIAPSSSLERPSMWNIAVLSSLGMYDYDAAFELYKHCLDIYPQSAAARYEIAQFYLFLGQEEKSERH